MRFWLSELFKARSTVSAMRVMAMLSLLIGGSIAYYGVFMKQDVTGLVSIFVTAAFAGKGFQKLAESKSSPDSK